MNLISALKIYVLLVPAIVVGVGLLALYLKKNI